MKTTIEDLQDFKHEAVVRRFQETWDVSLDEAEELFEETKKWLWLNAYCNDLAPKDRPPLTISQSTKLMDEMWHTFILFTQNYHDFCDSYFGAYIHHNPTPGAVYDEMIIEYERDPEKVIARNRALFARQYEFIYDILGEDTLVKWYDEYHDRYTDESLRQIWRWSFSPYDTRVREDVRAKAVGAVGTARAADERS